MRTSVPGVATGLAWTPVGGDILFIEATRMPGSGKLILTGQLGDVMKESAQAALSAGQVAGERARDRPDAVREERHPRARAGGAIPKDGPSAGVAMFTALVSLLTAAHGAQRRGDDRRDQPARAGAAGRRHQGEGAGGAARRASAP
jgi:ATP-dependent Lon protease